MHQQAFIISAALLLLALCAAIPAWAACPVESEHSGDEAMCWAEEVLAQIGASEGQNTVLLTDPGTGATVTPGAAPGEPRALTDEEMTLMESARPDATLELPEATEH